MDQDGLMKFTGHISKMTRKIPRKYFFLNAKIVPAMIFILKNHVKNKKKSKNSEILHTQSNMVKIEKKITSGKKYGILPLFIHSYVRFNISNILMEKIVSKLKIIYVYIKKMSQA